MAVSYKKLWKMLIDKDMKKKDLCTKAGISTASITKMGKGGHVTPRCLLRYVRRWIVRWMILWRFCLTKARYKQQKIM